MATCVDVHGTVVANAVRFWGSDAIREKWLPRLARRFSTAAAVAAPSATMQHAPLLLTEDEAMIQEAARSFATTEVAPLVRDMDRNSKMDDALIAQLFENGFMGVEADEADGGSGGPRGCQSALRFEA